MNNHSEPGKPRLLFYCQHILGMGHFARSIEIVKGLTAFDVYFLNGGDVIPNFELPRGVTFIDLPPIKSDAEFRQIAAADSALSLEAVKQARLTLILEACERIRPHIAIIELFPFGRRQFAFELLPMLERLRPMGTMIACSLRDILVARKHNREHCDERTCRIMNGHFDLLLIHSDPRFQRLDETFPLVSRLTCNIHYTGFVAQTPPAIRQYRNGKPLIVVSIGGGRVGGELLECAIEASAAIERSQTHHMRVFAGPFMPEEQWQRARRLAAGSKNVTLERFSPHFLEHMAEADLSISMAGYNTCMNVLAVGVRSLVYPFTGGDNEEQTIRARKLEQLGAVSILRPEDLTPGALGQRIIHSLQSPQPGNTALNVNGVARTAELLYAAVTEFVA